MRAITILILLAGTAQAQEVIDLHQHTNWMRVETYQRDPYSGIFNWAGVNCCNGDDCRKIVDPNDIEPISGGYRIRPTGEIVDKETTGISPDDAWHICRKSDTKRTIRCLLVPPGGA